MSGSRQWGTALLVLAMLLSSPVRADEAAPMGQGSAAGPDVEDLAVVAAPPLAWAPDRPDSRFSRHNVQFTRVVEPVTFRRRLDTPTISNGASRRAPFGVCYGMNLFAMTWFHESIQPVLSGVETEVRPFFGVFGAIHPGNVERYRLRTLQQAAGVKARAWAEDFQKWQHEDSHKASPQGFHEVFASIENSLLDENVQVAMLGIEPARGQWAHNVLVDRLLEGELVCGGIPADHRRVLYAEIFDPNFADQDPSVSLGFGIFFFPDAAPATASFSAEMLHFYNDTRHPLQPEQMMGDWQVTFEPTFSPRARGDRPSTWIGKRIKWRKPPETDSGFAYKLGNENYLFGWEGKPTLAPPPRSTR